MNELINGLFSFIDNSPTAFHAVDSIKNILSENGFEELTESAAWNVAPGGKYFVSRNASSIIAFKVGKDIDDYGFMIAASHSDSPAFKLKENAELTVRGRYTKLNTEGYGGMICSTWLDRPLSIAGRVIVRDGDKYITKLVNLDRDLVLIPNMAIHMNRDINDGFAYNKQVDMLPLLSGKPCEAGEIKRLLAEELGTEAEKIYGTDIFLYNRDRARVWGRDNEFISAPRLDDLECAYTSLRGFLRGGNEMAVQVYACFDNEEVGSGTKQGAASTFLADVLKRINRALGKSEEDYHRAVASSFMLSCDNAHAVHPNHPEKTDENNCTYMNGGVVIKSHAGQKYTSDAVSAAVFWGICVNAGVPVQFFSNRSDAAGGSTLGNIAMTQASMNCVDIGLAQLAMHSAYETAGINDVEYMVKATAEFFGSRIETENGILTLT